MVTAHRMVETPHIVLKIDLLFLSVFQNLPSPATSAVRLPCPLDAGVAWAVGELCPQRLWVAQGLVSHFLETLAALLSTWGLQ